MISDKRATSPPRKRTKFTDDKTEAEIHRITENFHEASGLKLKHGGHRKVLGELIRQFDIDNDANYMH
jgi:hypothetical protein